MGRRAAVPRDPRLSTFLRRRQPSRRPAREAEGAEAAGGQAGDGPARLRPLLRVPLVLVPGALRGPNREGGPAAGSAPPPWEVGPAPAGPRPPPSPRLSRRGRDTLGARGRDILSPITSSTDPSPGDSRQERSLGIGRTKSQ